MSFAKENPMHMSRIDCQDIRAEEEDSIHYYNVEHAITC